jgi:3,4-dihydroxy 2-butanone 4-phosphate synthase / GTP cyclohydrolase II
VRARDGGVLERRGHTEAAVDLARLVDLGVTTLRLMSNNQAKFVELEGYNLRIVGRVPLLVAPNCENIAYLRTKQLKLGHQLDVV